MVCFRYIIVNTMHKGITRMMMIRRRRRREGEE